MAGADETNEILMKLLDRTSRVETLVEGLVDHQFHARERTEIRKETREIVTDAMTGREEIVEAQIEAKASATREYAKKYTDERITDLERQLEGRQARDEAIAASVRKQFAMTVGVALVGIAYALYKLFTTGGV